MRISDWSSDVCSSDLTVTAGIARLLSCGPDGRSLGCFVESRSAVDAVRVAACRILSRWQYAAEIPGRARERPPDPRGGGRLRAHRSGDGVALHHAAAQRSEEHTSELQSLMRISYAVFCLKKKNIHI